MVTDMGHVLISDLVGVVRDGARLVDDAMSICIIGCHDLLIVGLRCYLQSLLDS